MMAEEKMFPSLVQSDQFFSQMPQGEGRTRRRRKKAKVDDSKKRKLSDDQAKFLEMSFVEEKKLESGRKMQLATELGLDPKQVAVWFQNRRARHKSKQVEDAYTKLKSLHDATVLEKCQLENEVLKLKERLLEAEEEIRSLSKLRNGAVEGKRESGSSSSSSFSIASHQPLVEELELEEDINFWGLPDYNYSNYIFDWQRLV